MVLKLNEIISLYFEINGVPEQPNSEEKNLLKGILKQKMSLKVKVYLQRLNKILVEEMKIYEDARQELFKKYGKEDNGTITIERENMADFTRENNELLFSERNLDIASLWGTDLTLDSLSSIETHEDYPVLYRLIDSKE